MYKKILVFMLLLTLSLPVYAGIDGEALAFDATNNIWRVINMTTEGLIVASSSLSVAAAPPFLNLAAPSGAIAGYVASTNTFVPFMCDVNGNLMLSTDAGVTTFLGLSDTPITYTGEEGKYAVVNAAGDGLEFAAAVGGVTSVNTATGEVTLTTGDLTEDTDKNYVTDAQLTVINNTSNINTGDETETSIKTTLGAASTSHDGYLTQTNWDTFNDKADNPMTTQGDIIYGGISGVANRLPIGSDGQIMTSNGTTMEWSDTASHTNIIGVNLLETFEITPGGFDIPDTATYNLAPLDFDQGTNKRIYFHAFDDTTSEYVQTQFTIKQGYESGSDFNYEFDGYSGTATGGVAFDVRIGHFSPTVGWDGTWASPISITDTSLVTAGQLNRVIGSAASSASYSVGDTIMLLISRDPDDASDDMTGDFNLTSFSLSYNRNTETSSDGVRIDGDVVFNYSSGDVDFTINKNTTGEAFNYDAGTDTHTFLGTVDLSGATVEGISTGDPSTDNIKMHLNRLNEYATGDNEGSVIINYLAYNDTNAYNRNLSVYDGKQVLMFECDGVDNNIRAHSDFYAKAELHVEGSAFSGATAISGSNLIINDGHDGPRLSMLAGVNGTSYITFGDFGDNDVGGFKYDHTNDKLTFVVNGSTSATIDNTGLFTGGDNRVWVFGDGKYEITCGDTSKAYLNFGDNDDNDIGGLIYDNSLNKMTFTINALESLVINNDTKAYFNSEVHTKGDIYVGVEKSGSDLIITSYNYATTTGSDAIIKAKVGGSDAGDAKLELAVQGDNLWNIGLDNSDSDKLKFTYNNEPGTDDTLELTSTSAQVNGKFILPSPTVPATAAATGATGEISYDDTHVYICVGTDTWVRADLATW